jgi:hypothetical protein
VFEYLFSSLLPPVFARLLLLLLMAIEKSEFSAVPPWMLLRCLQEIVVINQTIMSGEKTEIVTRNCHQMRFVCRARKGENVYTQNRRFPPPFHIACSNIVYLYSDHIKMTSFNSVSFFCFVFSPVSRTHSVQISLSPLCMSEDSVERENREENWEIEKSNLKLICTRVESEKLQMTLGI